MGLPFDPWMAKVARKVYRDHFAKELTATTPLDAFCQFAYQMPFQVVFGGGAPRGALVFYMDHLALSNGDGTVTEHGATASPEGSPLGWITAK